MTAHYICMMGACWEKTDVQCLHLCIEPYDKDSCWTWAWMSSVHVPVQVCIWYASIIYVEEMWLYTSFHLQGILIALMEFICVFLLEGSSQLDVLSIGMYIQILISSSACGNVNRKSFTFVSWLCILAMEDWMQRLITCMTGEYVFQ